MGKWSRKEDEAEYKLSQESGEQAVRELLDFYGAGTDNEDTPEAKKAEKALDELVKHYRRGRFENKTDENLGFTVIQHLQSGKPLTYREIKGKDIKVLDQYKGDAERTYGLLGKLCGLGEDAIMSLKKDDRDAAVALSVPFFAAL